MKASLYFSVLVLFFFLIQRKVLLLYSFPLQNWNCAKYKISEKLTWQDLKHATNLGTFTVQSDISFIGN